LDPVSHTVLGAALALTIVASGRNLPSRAVRASAAVWGALAGNAPDVDRVFDWCLKPFGPHGDGLAYLVYHRAETHTFVAGPAFAVVLTGLAALLPRKYRPALGWMFLISLLASWLHVLIDWTNDYGVHPFWPLWNRWFFGDFIFLVEPLVIGAVLPYCLMALMGLNPESERRAMRLTIGVGLAVGVAVALLVFFARIQYWLRPFGLLLAIIALLGQVALQWKQASATKAWASVGAVLVLFFFCSLIARNRAEQALLEQKPGHAITAIVTTPAPADPFCWRVIVVTRRQADFTARMGTYSMLWFNSPESCFFPPEGRKPSSVNEIKDSDLKNEGGWSWFSNFTAKLEEFEDQARTNDRVGASRTFYRVPFWGEDSRRPKHFLIGDLRFDYESDLGKYCKYSAPWGAAETFDARMPPWVPPFLGKRAH
jgi:inner membrane protein